MRLFWSLLLLIMFVGCSEPKDQPNMNPDVPTNKYAPKKSIAYEHEGVAIEWIDETDNECAMVQCGSKDDLCLVSIDKPSIQKHILGQENSVKFTSKFCEATKWVMLKP